MNINVPLEIGSEVCIRNEGWIAEEHGDTSTGKVNSIKIYVKKNKEITICFSVAINGYNDSYRIDDDRIIYIK